MRPGFFGLVDKICVKEAAICGAEPVVQSAELGDGVSIFFFLIDTEGDNLLAVPNDGLQTKDFFGDGASPHVGVTVWWPPISRDTSARGIVNQLHCPTQLNNMCEERVM